MQKNSIIDEVPRITTIPPQVPKEVLRVACYARVSTEYSDQDSSIQAQTAYYEQIISSHPGWELAGIYQERISGTGVKDRPQLALLLEACRLSQIDLILVKSVSRFSRSTTDLLRLVRTLKSYGTRIIFEQEHIDTDSASGELMLSLLAAFAESEVRSISDNNKWAIRSRFELGQYRYSCVPYGYDNTDGHVTVNAKEAEVVRFIFTTYLEGAGLARIARMLDEKGIPTKRAGANWTKGRYSGHWHPSTIRQILENVFYVGDCLLQKNYHDENYRIRKNKGELPMYYLEDHHEAIIDSEIFEKTQEMIRERASRSRKKQSL